MRKAKILIIDDEKIVLSTYSKELTAAGYDVFTASNGRTALEIVRQEKPDIVFTDLVMPHSLSYPGSQFVQCVYISFG